MCNITYPKFPCRICVKNVSDKDKAVQCDLCELWVHIKCNNLNYLDYRYLQNSNKSWYCIECCSTIFPFNSLSSSKSFLACCTNTDDNSTHWIDLENDHNQGFPYWGGLGGSPPHYPKNWLVPPMPPPPTVLTQKCRFCHFHAVFGHFVQIVPPTS